MPDPRGVRRQQRDAVGHGYRHQAGRGATDQHFEYGLEFSSIRDAIDEDYVPLGSEEVSTEEEIIFEAVITIARNLDEGIDVAEADVALSQVTVNFGTVESFHAMGLLSTLDRHNHLLSPVSASTKTRGADRGLQW